MMSNRPRVLALATACLLLAGAVTLMLRPGIEAGAPAGIAIPSLVTSIKDSASADEEIVSDPYADLFTRAAIERRRRAHKREGDAFAGYVNGIRIDLRSRPRCSDFRLMTKQEIREHQLPSPTRLPPLATEWRQQGWACGEEPYGVDRSFQMGGYPVFLTVARLYDRSSYVFRAGRTRVSPGMIQGRPAVFIRPLTPQGQSGSLILFKDGDDMIIFKGVDIRFAHLREAAESLPLQNL